jgi:hypothetical protein
MAASRITDDARFDGLHVLRTNSNLNMLSVELAYRELWRVEAIFKTAKSILETRPIFHQSDAAIAGHLFCSFLALLLRNELDERLTMAGANAEWNDIVRDLDRVEQVTIEQGPSALCCDHRPLVAPARCSRRSVWRCCRWSSRSRPPHRRPLSHQPHRPAAADARGVVPRRPEFSTFLFYII